MQVARAASTCGSPDFLVALSLTATSVVPTPWLTIYNQVCCCRVVVNETLLFLQALQHQMTELETKLVQARSDSKAQVKGHNSGKKELEARAQPSHHFNIA